MVVVNMSAPSSQTFQNAEDFIQAKRAPKLFSETGQKSELMVNVLN